MSVRLSYADVNGNGSINLPNEILEENNYYPFGLKHKGYNEIVNSNRSEAAEKYKFGGKELNDELGLDLYDFGARNYDAAIGRWLNVDPLAEKHRDFSPFVYTANNPILYVDKDGKDYIIYIDHINKSITVKATYYTAKGSADSYNSALRGATTWNNQSGKYSYSIGKKENKIDYKINFELTVKEVENPVTQKIHDGKNYVADDKKQTWDGSSNTYRVLPDDDKRFENDKEHTQTNGTTVGGNSINIKDSRKDTDTTTHEMGHTLGVKHTRSGVMTANSNDPKRSETINKSIIKQIFNNAANNTGPAESSIINTGDIPDDFDLQGGNINNQ